MCDKEIQLFDDFAILFQITKHSNGLLALENC